MPSPPDLLSAYELCQRKGAWTRSWERLRMDGMQMILAAMRAGVTEAERPDFAELAGETVMELGEDRGIETPSHTPYDSLIHHAALADILTAAVRKPAEAPWGVPDAVSVSGHEWRSAALLSPEGTHLRRFVTVSHWSDDRHFSEARSWYSMGEVCAYGLPMQQIVLVLGPHRDGKRHSPWTKGLLHPSGNKMVRFRRRTDVGAGFKESWLKIWREDYADIDRMTWLEAMLTDGVLGDVCFVVDIPVPEAPERQRILDLTARKLDRIAAIRELPDQQLTGCDFPVPCVFRDDCHAGKEPREGRFIHIAAL